LKPSSAALCLTMVTSIVSSGGGDAVSFLPKRV